MKKLRVILPAVAFVMAIVTAYASIPASFLADNAKGLNSGSCQTAALDDNRTLGTSAGQCAIVNEMQGVCTVTFSITPVTAFTPTGTCQDNQTLYIQQ